MGNLIYKKFFKRFIDIVISLLALAIFSPFLILLSLLIYTNLGSPIIFHQSRVGKDEKVFKILKFRSMSNSTDENGKLLPDEKRLNNFGIFLRKTGMDELPELINVLRGEMSLVGPRPLLTHYLIEYSEFHKRRHTVRPGITGLSQVNGRNDITWKKRLDTDIEYVDNYGFIMDIKIILRTFITLITFNGSTPKGSVIMEEYKRGSNETD